MSEEGRDTPPRRGTLSSVRASRAAKAAAGIISAGAGIVAIVAGVGQIGSDDPAGPTRLGAVVSTIVSSPGTRADYERARVSPRSARPVLPDDLPDVVEEALDLPADVMFATSSGFSEVQEGRGVAGYLPSTPGRIVDFSVTLDGLEGRDAYVTAEVIDAASGRRVRPPAGEILEIHAEAQTDTVSSNLFVPLSRSGDDEGHSVRVSVWDDRGVRLTFADSDPFPP